MTAATLSDRIFIGQWTAAPGHEVYAYAERDFLRDRDGQLLALSFNQAMIELAERNQGWQAGNGTEAALRDEIAAGSSEFEGQLVLPPTALLEDNIYAALKAGRLPHVAEALRLAQQAQKPDQVWALSSTLYADSRSLVRMFMLTRGISARCYMDNYRVSVLPIRFYRDRTP